MKMAAFICLKVYSLTFKALDNRAVDKKEYLIIRVIFVSSA